jgi:serine/threonine protein kinase
VSVDVDAPLPSPHPQNALALRPGALIHARFRVSGLLGASAYSFTYSAVDEQYNERVVVKEFFPRSLVTRLSDSAGVRAHSSADDQEFARGAKRFLREGELLADLSHPSLLRVRRAFEENGTAYVIANFHPVTPLREYMRAAGGRLLVGAAVEMCTRLLEALEIIHSEGGLHRDISPDTVGVDAARRPVVVGFPAARHLQGHGRDLTAGFAPIELYGAKGYGPWTDVYSCAALLYYMITGVVPPSAVERAAGQAVTSPSSLVGGLSPSFVNAVLRGLSQLPEHRPHSASEFQKQLVAAMYDTAQPTSATPVADISPALTDRPASPPVAAPPVAPQVDAGHTLRLTAAGLVIPEERSFARRVLQWLTGDQSPSEAATEEREPPIDSETAEILSQLNTLGIGRAANAADALRTAQLAAPPEVTASQPETAAPTVVSAPLLPVVDDIVSEEAPLLDRETPIVSAQEETPTIADVAEVAPPAKERADIRTDAAAPFDSFEALILEAEQRAAARARHAEALQAKRLEEDARAAQSAPDTSFAKRSFDDSFSAKALDADAFETDIFDAYTEAEREPSYDLPELRPRRTFGTRALPRFHLPSAITRRSRAAVVVGVILIFAGAAVGVAYAARLQSGRARNDGEPKALPDVATRQAGSSTTAPSAGTDLSRNPRVETSSAGVLQQNVHTPVRESTPATRKNDPTISASRQSTDKPEPDPVPSLANIQQLNVPISTQAGTPQLLPPELLIDLRDRLAAGRQFADGGDYQSAGRVLRGAINQIDSLASRYSVSEALRLLRKDVETEAQKTLDACLAENEIHKKRGGKVLVCQ